MACGEKPAYGYYRRATWWLRRKENLPVNRKRVLRVMRERSCWCVLDALRARRKKERGRVEAADPKSDLAVGHDENLGGASRGPGRTWYA